MIQINYTFMFWAVSVGVICKNILSRNVFSLGEQKPSLSPPLKSQEEYINYFYPIIDYQMSHVPYDF